jgi:hypothetical protein
MKNYLYKFELITGLYEAEFFQQINAEDEKDAIVQLVGYFKGLDGEETLEFLNGELGENWTIEKFWKRIDTRFFNRDETEGYNLIWIKEIGFDLDTVGKYI